MSGARFIVGDVREVMATIPDGSVDLVLTSPPFLALRSYLPSDHVQKHLEIGSEPTPAAFLDTLLALSAEWRRVLAPHGSICVELGDTYSGSGGGGGDYNVAGWRDGQPRPTGSELANRGRKRAELGIEAPARKARGDAWPAAKSLCMIPALYSASLAYGRNLLTGEPSPAGQWRVRNIVRWCRPNPPVGALGDKFRPATSEMTIACVSGSRYFDLDATREPVRHPDATAVLGEKNRPNDANGRGSGRRLKDYDSTMSAGAPPLDWWEIPTQPYKGAHYATWPDDLLVRPIKAMVPQRVCTTCGEPSRRITGEVEYVPSATNRGGILKRDGERTAEGANQWVGADGSGAASVVRQAPTLGWSDCGHGSWRPGLCLDPFAGSGTTLAVAVGHGRDALGIDLDSRNADLAVERLGMFLTVEHHVKEGAA